MQIYNSQNGKPTDRFTRNANAKKLAPNQIPCIKIDSVQSANKEYKHMDQTDDRSIEFISVNLSKLKLKIITNINYLHGQYERE